MTPLPAFRYHPDPVATGSIEESNKTCICCGEARGYIYVASVYAVAHLDEQICPWCIADGSAATKFSASFVSYLETATPEISKEIEDEILHRTPGYISWQGEEWLTCCQDACEFHGDAQLADIANASPATITNLMNRLNWPIADWNKLAAGYVPCGDTALYKFVCRHCKAVHLGMDCS